MQSGFSFFPERASTFAGEVDSIYVALIAISVFFGLLIFGLIAFFSVRYRRKSDSEVPKPIHGSLPLELLWSVIPLGISLVLFGWGAKLYFEIYTPPQNAMEILVTGKQWMWKIQHPTGQREINELHVPKGVPIKLTMTSEDVIHSFYVPAFRVKRDVLPGRFTSAWFEATKSGEYHLFCAEYCGTKHSQMIGRVTVLEPAAYEDWLSGRSGESPVTAGAKKFEKLGCITCHKADSGGRGPNLAGVFGKPVQLTTGETILVDETYIRESILKPQEKLVQGYQPLMPTFAGQVDDEGLVQLVAYIKSLEKEETGDSTVGEATAGGEPAATEAQP